MQSSPRFEQDRQPSGLQDSRLLAQHQIYLRISDEAKFYATLHGQTFPFSHSLAEVGAHWSDQEQSWVFPDESSYQCFIGILETTSGQDQVNLAEDSSFFVGDSPPNTPLKRFMEFGGNSMENTELLELLLSFDSYVIDPTTLGCRLIDEFGSLGAVLASEPAQLKQVENITPRTSSLLKAIQLTLERVMHEPIKDNPVLGSWDALLKFLAIRLQHRKVEELLVIYLDRKNRLIKTDSTSGTVNHVALYPRNIASRALELFASAVILAHNHPGGNPTASKADITMTKKVKNALEALDIALYDHVIISHGEHFSFHAEGLI